MTYGQTEVLNKPIYPAADVGSDATDLHKANCRMNVDGRYQRLHRKAPCVINKYEIRSDNKNKHLLSTKEATRIVETTC